MGEEVFSKYQKTEIEEGIKQGVNVSVYSKPELFAIQMRQIRLGLADNLPMERYAKPEYDWFQLEEIRLGLKSGIDVSKYDDSEVSYELMRQIRLGLESGIDLSVGTGFSAGVLKQFRIAICEDHVDIGKYIKAGYDEEQLTAIRTAIKNEIDIEPYVSLAKRGSAIREIELGLSKGLDVTLYSDDDFNWQQMREIRLGLEHRLEVTTYNNSLYSWQQMREIRLGLEENLPVEQYMSFMYTAKEMKRIRRSMMSDNRSDINERENYVQYAFGLLMISEDWMEAKILFTCDKGAFTKDDIYTILKENDIRHGIRNDVIDKLEETYQPGDMVTVATGEKPGEGKDGWYEYYFETNMKYAPKVLENGGVDYKNVKWFEMVKKGQKVAYYHAPERGKPGQRIDGQKIRGVIGRQLPSIEGRGILRLADQRTYISKADGKIELKDGKIIVSDLLVLEDVTRINGNIDFHGSVYVQGNVQDGVVIKAHKDVLVDGFIEASRIEAGGDVILRNGNNAGGNGFIRAGGDVMGSFFENTYIEAGHDITANYCLNCELSAKENIIIQGRIGVLAGGKYKAGRSISSYQIGNESGLLTVLNVGKMEDIMKQKSEVTRRQEKVERELTMLRNAYNDFVKKLPAEIRNTNEMYLKIESAIYTKQLEMKEIHAKLQEMDEIINESQNANVFVNGTIYSGVLVDIDGKKWNAYTTENVTLKNNRSKIRITKNA